MRRRARRDPADPADPFQRMIQLLERAHELADAREHAEAAAQFAVAADVAEEIDDHEMAHSARSLGRQHHIIAWAQRQWPNESIGYPDVQPEAPFVNREWTRFSIRRLDPRTGGTRKTLVTMNRRGLITVNRQRWQRQR